MCLYQTVHHLVSNISLVFREAIMVILEENKFAFSDFHAQYYCLGCFFLLTVTKEMSVGFYGFFLSYYGNGIELNFQIEFKGWPTLLIV